MGMVKGVKGIIPKEIVRFFADNTDYRRALAQVERVESISTARAVICLDCERITEVKRDACPVCGSRALLNLATILSTETR